LSSLTVEVEDASEWAGWLFADMLVGLMVIFLATITFVPDAGESQATLIPQDGNYTYIEKYEDVFSGVYMMGGVDQLQADVNDFIKDRGIPEDAVVASAFFVAGYDPETEQSQSGMQRALAFSKEIDKNDSTFLSGAPAIVKASVSLNPNQIAVQLTFSSRVTQER
jgi:hypothetical protein